MALVDIYNCWAAEGGLLKAKFIGACLKSAYYITIEDSGTANHANRLTWANSILSGTKEAVEAAVLKHIRYAVAGNATLQAAGDDVTDNDVEYIVAAQLDTIANW
jgi:hypothetical protein